MCKRFCLQGLVSDKPDAIKRELLGNADNYMRLLESMDALVSYCLSASISLFLLKKVYNNWDSVKWSFFLDSKTMPDLLREIFEGICPTFLLTENSSV